jgi:hypothetical protein
MTIKMSKKDSDILKVLNHMKLQAVKVEVITIINLPSLLIKAMRLIENVKGTIGSEKKSTVIDIILLLIQQYGEDELSLEIGTLELMLESLFQSDILHFKKGCC